MAVEARTRQEQARTRHVLRILRGLDENRAVEEVLLGGITVQRQGRERVYDAENARDMHTQQTRFREENARRKRAMRETDCGQTGSRAASRNTERSSNSDQIRRGRQKAQNPELLARRDISGTRQQIIGRA